MGGFHMKYFPNVKKEGSILHKKAKTVFTEA